MTDETATRVHVTADHIQHGLRARCDTCPIALALTAAFPGQRAWVDTGIAYIGKRLILLPKAARTFIAEFDAGKKVEPFTFEVKLAA